ncbi:DegT/DnrJ/EryC1/StrS family aminotransferase [Photobacterium swingsii]|uniref:DegT/DnrJ/EryC1/StrS family aminotransferase n=1 Tax=Photobacterium swingsii TaxID=680026 RepID=UPI004068A052
MNDFLPFSLPDIGDAEINEVVDTLRSGWVTTGPKARQFELDFEAYLGSNVSALAVNSATSGLHLALEAIGVGDGDEVIVPSYTFTATAEVVRYLGADPIIVDVEENTFNIDTQAIKNALSPRTKAIIPVHFAGLACNMDEIILIARENNIRVIEDAAHALPCSYNGQLIGTLNTDVTVFSFYANKTMTSGEGGMLVSRDENIIERCKVMRLHGINRDAFDRYQSTKPSWHYEIIAPGFKYNMPDICAALGLQQLKRLNDFHTKRSVLADFYDEALKELPLKLPPRPKNNDLHAWHLYPVMLTSESNITRDLFIEKMSQRGIGCSVHFIPLHSHPYWQEEYNLKEDDFIITNELYLNEVSIPLYTKMTLDDAQRVVDAIKDVLEL